MATDPGEHTAASLAAKYTREELDGLAREGGLDPADYATKDELATAIMGTPATDDGEADDTQPELAPAPEPEPVNTIDAGPPPITPSSSASQHEARIGFENDVNARAEDFLASIRVQVIEALLQGHTVELTVIAPKS